MELPAKVIQKVLMKVKVTASSCAHDIRGVCKLLDDWPGQGAFWRPVLLATRLDLESAINEYTHIAATLGSAITHDDSEQLTVDLLEAVRIVPCIHATAILTPYRSADVTVRLNQC